MIREKNTIQANNFPKSFSQIWNYKDEKYGSYKLLEKYARWLRLSSSF